MTIGYQDQFFKLLLRWRGSLWKTIWKDAIIFSILYYAINIIYRFWLNEEQKKHFMQLIALFNGFTDHVPLTFLLGFYVAMVTKRWWEQFQLLSWPDSFLYFVSSLIKGTSDDVRVIRTSIARYCILSTVLAWRSISVRVLMRFPTDEHLVASGLLTAEEFKLFQSVQVKTDPHKKWFVPLNWIQSIIVRCFEQGHLTHTNEMRALMEELAKFRYGFFNLFLYDWVTIPLVYTQVATIAVYGYFFLCLCGRQYPKYNDHQQVVDLYVPIFTILQFFFYVGWLKVGEDLMFPFGSDDEDFELNVILDRNLEMAYLIVGDLHLQMPPLHVDSANVVPILRETKGSAKLKRHPQCSHLADFRMTEEEKEIAGPTISPDWDVGPNNCASFCNTCLYNVHTVACLPCDIVTALTTTSPLTPSRSDEYFNRSYDSRSGGRVANGPAPVNTRTDVLALQPRIEAIPSPIPTSLRKQKSTSRQSSVGKSNNS